MQHILALDIGDKRVGVAIASLEALLASPLVTLSNDPDLVPNILKLIKDNDVHTVVVGLPRNLSGKDSQQTIKVRETIEELKSKLNVDIATQDEALSSVRAEEELSKHGKILNKADIDKLAACLILEDYISSLKS